MTTLQIVLLSIIGAFALVSIVFMILFLIEITVGSKEEKEVEVKSIFSSENYVKEVTKVETVDTMLAKLDEQAKEEKTEEPRVVSVKKEELEEAKNEPEVVSVEETEVEETVENVEVQSEEVKEEAETEEVVEQAEEDPDQEVEEEIVEEKEESKVEEIAEESAVEEVSNNAETVEVDAVKVDAEPVVAANLLDYKARLASVIESRDKLNKDLIKIEKSILNYERTKRRKSRNQKMLDRRASELTNLNLVMYSVTDIKNVDEEKKIKQEELTSHIAELKASIQDAEEFLDSNKEKNEHDIKMAKFLIQEKARFKEEIAELEALIAKTEGNGSVTEA